MNRHRSKPVGRSFGTPRYFNDRICSSLVVSQLRPSLWSSVNIHLPPRTAEKQAAGPGQGPLVGQGRGHGGPPWPVFTVAARVTRTAGAPSLKTTRCIGDRRLEWGAPPKGWGGDDVGESIFVGGKPPGCSLSSNVCQGYNGVCSFSFKKVQRLRPAGRLDTFQGNWLGILQKDRQFSWRNLCHMDSGFFKGHKPPSHRCVDRCVDPPLPGTRKRVPLLAPNWRASRWLESSPLGCAVD